MKNKKYYKIVLISLILISLVVLLATVINFNDSKEVKLTTEEKQWIKKHSGKVTIAYTPNYEPVEFLNRSGDYVGMSADYFDLLEQKLNLDFKMIKVDSWDEVLKGAKNKEFYGITAATRTPDRSEYLNFTKPYINNPNVIISKKALDEKLTLEKLEQKDLKVLVIEGYAIIEYLEKNYPKLKFETVKDTKTGIREVSFDQADVLIVEIMSASAAIDRDNISNLKLNNETSFESNLSIATRKDMPILNDILNKGLAKISENQKKVIKERWMIFEEKSLLENEFFWIIIFSILFVISIIIFTIITWNRTLKKNVEQKTKELQESEKRFKALAEYSTDIIMRFDKKYRHLYVNPAVKKITDLSLDKFIGKTSRQLNFPNHLSNRLEKSIDKVFNTKTSHNFEFKYKENWYNLSLMPEFSKKDEKKFVSAVITSARDITQLKKTQQKIKYQSFHDPLTGLYNRTYYNTKLSHYKKEQHLPLGFILADINGLKLTNDTLGHIKGDKLIKAIANILEESSSKKDLVVRIGGDEFLILVPNTDKKEIEKIFAKIKKKCRETEDAPIKPSVAIGYSIKYKADKSFDAVFKEAEDKMYQHKMSESENTHNTILDSLKDIIFDKTEETYEHIDFLKQKSIELGKAMNLSESKLNSLKLLAESKDLGKIGLNNSHKNEDRHVEIGYKIAKSSSKLNQISDAILAHHEKWNGTGYPKGLKGKEIPLIARIISVIEFYYRLIKKESIKNKEVIIKKLKEKSGKVFDPEIVKVFIKDVL